jgi:hypothetical protein
LVEGTEGTEGVIVVDPSISKETAVAALAPYTLLRVFVPRFRHRSS